MTWLERKIILSDVFTNDHVGSIKEIKIKKQFRLLTSAEIQLAKSIYKNSINYASVKIIYGSFLPLNMQDDDTLITPNGHIYVMPKNYSSDYSQEEIYDKKIFIHEMGHIWQHQQNLSVLVNAGALQICSAMTNSSYNPYKYNIWESPTVAQYVRYKKKAKRFLDYNLEAQAEIFSDYWLLKNNYDKKYMRDENKKNILGDMAKVLAMYESKIKEVIQ